MVVLLLACLSRYLDAPYVLATGLGEPLQLDPGTTPESFTVTAAMKVIEVDGRGRTRETAAPVRLRPPLHAGALTATTLPEGVAWVDEAGTLRLGVTVLIEGLERPRALTHDREGRLYLVAGADDPKLYRVDSGRLVLIAEFVGPVVDAAWGTGGALPERMLYLLREDGILEYLDPP